MQASTTMQQQAFSAAVGLEGTRACAMPTSQQKEQQQQQEPAPWSIVRQQHLSPLARQPAESLGLPPWKQVLASLPTSITHCGALADYYRHVSRDYVQAVDQSQAGSGWLAIQPALQSAAKDQGYWSSIVRYTGQCCGEGTHGYVALVTMPGMPALAMKVVQSDTKGSLATGDCLFNAVLHGAPEDWLKQHPGYHHLTHYEAYRVMENETGGLTQQVVMLLADGGALADHVDRTFDPLYTGSRHYRSATTSPLGFTGVTIDLMQATEKLVQVSCGVRLLHDVGVVHGDVKTENVVLERLNERQQAALGLHSPFWCRVTDFTGIAPMYTTKWGDAAPCKGCTPCFTSPELMSRMALGTINGRMGICCTGLSFHRQADDVYAFGFMVIELVLGNGHLARLRTDTFGWWSQPMVQEACTSSNPRYPLHRILLAGSGDLHILETVLPVMEQRLQEQGMLQVVQSIMKVAASCICLEADRISMEEAAAQLNSIILNMKKPWGACGRYLQLDSSLFNIDPRSSAEQDGGASSGAQAPDTPLTFWLLGWWARGITRLPAVTANSTHLSISRCKPPSQQESSNALSTPAWQEQLAPPAAGPPAAVAADMSTLAVPAQYIAPVAPLQPQGYTGNWVRQAGKPVIPPPPKAVRHPGAGGRVASPWNQPLSATPSVEEPSTPVSAYADVMSSASESGAPQSPCTRIMELQVPPPQSSSLADAANSAPQSVAGQPVHGAPTSNLYTSWNVATQPMFGPRDVTQLPASHNSPAGSTQETLSTSTGTGMPPSTAGGFSASSMPPSTSSPAFSTPAGFIMTAEPPAKAVEIPRPAAAVYSTSLQMGGHGGSATKMPVPCIEVGYGVSSCSHVPVTGWSGTSYPMSGLPVSSQPLKPASYASKAANSMYSVVGAAKDAVKTVFGTATNSAASMVGTATNTAAHAVGTAKGATSYAVGTAAGSAYGVLGAAASKVNSALGAATGTARWGMSKAWGMGKRFWSPASAECLPV